MISLGMLNAAPDKQGELSDRSLLSRGRETATLHEKLLRDLAELIGDTRVGLRAQKGSVAALQLVHYEVAQNGAIAHAHQCKSRHIGVKARLSFLDLQMCRFLTKVQTKNVEEFPAAVLHLSSRNGLIKFKNFL